jgi:hypothetical protein
VQELLYEPFRCDTALQTREHRLVKEKRHIGFEAAELVAENETIGLTAGTPTTLVARSLRHRSNLTIVTNARHGTMQHARAHNSFDRRLRPLAVVFFVDRSGRNQLHGDSSKRLRDRCGVSPNWSRMGDICFLHEQDQPSLMRVRIS